MIEKSLMQLRARDHVGADEEAALRGVFTQVRTYPSDRTVIEPGVDVTVSTLLLDGLMCRYRDLRNGQRQITGLHVPGDFLDLHSLTLKHLDHGILALTPCRAAIAPHERLIAITEDFPHLTRLFWFLTNLDAAIHREWAVSLGRRPAIARVAHLLCELKLRLGVVGLADAGGYPLALTQSELGECLGLTTVHVNRMLRELRERGLAEFRNGRVAIRDFDGLARVAEFDPAYLYLEKRPR
jgi:CRP-like cAMP-binding protein